ncbi:MAG: HNH endonuclease [Aeriscardovia sp.]|nr:HNH endonuclease [Aeriscardovia sp.]
MSKRRQDDPVKRILRILLTVLLAVFVCVLLTTGGAWQDLASTLGLQTNSGSLTRDAGGQPSAGSAPSNQTNPTANGAANGTDNEQDSNGSEGEYDPDGSEGMSYVPDTITSPTSMDIAFKDLQLSARDRLVHGDGSALRTLNTLETAPLGPSVGYNRVKDFGPAWPGILGKTGGCDTRNVILERDMTDTAVKPSDRCDVVKGVIFDPYTGRLEQFTRGYKTSGEIQIDHEVALENAYRSGAMKLSYQQRVQLANDPLELVAASGRQNVIKGADNAAGWLPAYQPYDCLYVARQIAVKAKYRLSVTPQEKQAMLKTLDTCPMESLPTENMNEWGAAVSQTGT